MTTNRIGLLIGITASISGIILWVILIFSAQYEKETFLVFFLFFALPAIIGFIALILKKNILLYIAFYISFPLSLYTATAGTPGIFVFFLAVSLGYLVSALLITIDKTIRKEKI